MKVFVECYHDTALVRELGVPTSDIRHEKGRGEVFKRVNNSDQPVFGFIDEDPQSSNRPKDFSKYRTIQQENEVKLYQHESDIQKRLVEFCPRLEEWTIRQSQQSGINLQKYKIPDNAHDFHANPRFDKNPNFGKWLKALNHASPGFKTLKKWLESA